MRVLLDRAVERGEVGDAARIDPAALDYAAEWTQGDARAALNGLELAADAAGPEGRVTVEAIADALQGRLISYDRAADNHYDTISAWIKATRGSDPDASLYYLAVMLEGGEDPRFIVRRMVILASEDIGNADPQALVVATAAAAAVEHVGLPEAEFALAQCAIYLSLATKSDAAKRAIGRRPAATSGRTAPRRHPDICARRPASRVTTTTRTIGRAMSPRRSCCHLPSPGRPSTSPTTPRRSSGTASKRFGRPADAERR